MTRHPWLGRAAAVLFGLLLAAGTAEGGARLVSRARGGLPVLDEYETRDPERPWLVRLRPGYAATLDELLAGKRQRGRTLAVEHLVRASESLGFRGDAVALRINRQGFKGPEIDPSHTRPRVLNIGDSCTFGSLLDWYSYPRALERALLATGPATEVVNGGVEGYAPRDVLARIEEFRSLRPEVATLYLGWNALYAEPAVSGVARWSHAARLARRGYERAVSGRDPRAAALEAYARPKRPDRARAGRELEGYVPSFLPEVERVAREMRSAGSIVVLVTLPGLYVTDAEPSARALRVGHLPSFTDNPYVLAGMAERYNAALRELAGREGYRLVDLDRWSRGALLPRDAYFSDSVHLTERGQAMIGEYLARELAPLLANRPATRIRRD